VAKSGDTIVFAPQLAGSTIKLAGTELLISKSLNIQGPGADLLAISAGGKSRVLEVAGVDTAVTITGITLRDGKADQGGGLKDTAASQALTDVQLRSNQAVGGYLTSALGGGLYAQGANASLT
jgi:hypothetical protein